MNIKIFKRPSKKFFDFEKKEWDIVDKQRYGKLIDWNPKKFVIVAYDNNIIVGSIDIRIKVGIVEVETLIVKESYRGKRIGTALFLEVEKIAKKHEAHKIYLITGKGWEAENFYQNLGMTKTGEMPKHYGKLDYVEYSKFI